MDPVLVAAIRHLVDDLAAARFTLVAGDGRSGRLCADEMQRAINEYGRTLAVLPDDAVGLMSAYVSARTAGELCLDVSLWTKEEGRSDLTLQLTASPTPEGYKLEITDIRVL